MDTAGHDNLHAPPGARCARFLVVEDDPPQARLLMAVIKRYGQEGTVAFSVREALHQLASRTMWAGIIVDLGLQDGSGFTVLRHLRAKDPNKPALVFSGSIEHDALNEAFDLQAQYLAKPATPSQIESFLRTATRKSCDSIPAPALPIACLPEDLRELANDVVRTWARLEETQSEYAYRMALLARAANGRYCDGRSLTEICADVVEVSRQTLQSYAAVTTRWSPEQVKDLLELRDRRGRALTLTHLLRFARARGPVRQELVKRASRPEFDVRQVLALLEEAGDA